MTEFIIKMSTEVISDIYPVSLDSISSIENKKPDEIINLVENYFFRFSPKDIKARKDPYYEGPDELTVLREIFRHFMVYEESQKVIINTCSIKPVELYISTFGMLLADLEANSSGVYFDFSSPLFKNTVVDFSSPLFKNTANVVMNGVLEINYKCRILDSASKEARLAFATWTNPTYLIGN